jgi:flagellar protein FlbD
MIKLTRLNRVPLILNSDLIEHIDTTPDTVVSLTTGQKFMVLETSDEVVEKVIQFRRSLAVGVPGPQPGTPDAAECTHGR